MLFRSSVVLGAASPHVIDVAAAYATFAAQGVYAAPWYITEVDGANGGVLYQATPPTPNIVFTKDVMADLTFALQQVVNNGTATYGTAGLGRPAAGKTGTTNDSAAVWFDGFTPDMAAAVWVGDPRGGSAYPMKNITINGVHYDQRSEEHTSELQSH